MVTLAPPDEATGAVGDRANRPVAARPQRPSWLRIHPVWIFIIAACALVLRTAMHQGVFNDAFWDLAAGRWMLAHHQVIRRDVFTYTIYGHPWVADEWGYEVLLAWLVRTIGGVSFWIVSAGAIIAAILVSVARSRLLGAGWLWAGMLTLLGSLALLTGLSPRPQDLGYFFQALELLILTASRRDRRWLLTLPPLFLVWANIHGSFLAGLAVLLLEVLLAVARARRWGRVEVTRPLPLPWIGGVSLASLLATFVNPHGPGLLRYELHVVLAPQLTSFIQEWQSPNFHDLLFLVIVIGPAAVLLAVALFTDTTFELFDLVFFIGTFLATLHAERFMPLEGLAWWGLAARFPILRRDGIRSTWLTWPIAAFLAFALVHTPHPPAGSVTRGGPNGLPVRAAAFVEHQSGRVFSTYTWNDYLIYLGVPVFVDGRTDLYFGTGVLATYINVQNLTVNPNAVFRRYDVRWVLWPPDSAVSIFLQHSPLWRIVYQDKDALVFEHIGSWSGTT